MIPTTTITEALTKPVFTLIVELGLQFNPSADKNEFMIFSEHQYVRDCRAPFRPRPELVELRRIAQQKNESPLPVTKRKGHEPNTKSWFQPTS